MAIYRVLVPSDAAAAAAEFIRDGFCWPALLFGPLWLLARGLWWALLVWCLGATAVGTAAHYDLVPGSAAAWLYVLSALWLGLEGTSLAAAARMRVGWRLLDVAAGSDRTDAELSFFSRWLAAPPAASPPAAAPPRPAVQGGVIGLFPEAGG